MATVATPPVVGPAARDPLRRAGVLAPVLAVIALLLVPGGGGAQGGTGGTGTVADAASGLLVLICLVRVVRGGARPLTRTAAVVLGLPVLGICLAAITSNDPASSLPGVARYVQVFVLVPAAVLLTVRDRRDFAVVAWTLAGLALFQGAVGVAQYLTGTGASYQGEDVRAVGTFGATDVMGMATVVSYGLVVVTGIALGSGPGRARTAALVCAGLLFLPLVLSFSRGAWIATVLACALQLLLAGPLRAVRVGLAAGALGVVLVGGLGIGSDLVEQRVASITRVTAAPDQSVTDRYTMWAAAGEMWRAEPLTGVGLKGFPRYRDAHASVALSSGSDTAGAGAAFRRQPLLSPHNMYLLVLSEQGLVGLLALVGSWSALLVGALRRRPGQGTRPGSGPGADCALVATGLLVWQLVDFFYADIGGPSTVLMSVVLGLAAWWSLVGARRA
ncbi:MULTISPECIES: O-antigen ligase family protein [unclassified Streptomyces]|uniref:O-antigen ligase family protein n=1 Tax=unclassified Streptomyces TaxID=2593676 RepID=UPI0006B00761|nr:MULTISPECIES: O-antigen ligase family protein [unclassified Streptomyces]KOX37761.1 membrane protein [Streptomyces sp. NRRL F-6491]KOX52276.1 membrane protein [Streptomyces sp. NRRL F-6492]